MTLLVKFKSGKIIKYAEVDDTELYDGYLYVYMRDGRLIRCRSRVVKYYVEKYETRSRVLHLSWQRTRLLLI